MTETVAIIGAGLIGRAWAVAFARAGWNARLWDPVEGAARKSAELALVMASDLEEADLLNGQAATTVAARIGAVETLAETLHGATWLQENAPERLDVKRELWERLDAMADPALVMASSTSALLPSAFSAGLPGAARCMVAHPINPPHLIPSVELVPSEWTSPEAMRRAEQVMRGIGQEPIVTTREIDGFVVNRLQGALMEEAFRLVADGICGPDDIDVALKHGLALRWSFMGMFETIDLNAPGGVADYIRRYQGMYVEMFPSMQRRVDWEGPVLPTVEGVRRERLPLDRIAERSRWRDRRLMALLRHKRDAAKKIGD